MKNIVILNGSPRKQGYTSQMIEVFIESLNNREYEFDIYNCGDLEISFCVDCRYCEKNYKCVINDDMQEIYNKLENADIILFATPVYFYTVSAQLKRVIDRLQVYYFRNINKSNNFKNKKGILFAVGGAKEYNEQFKSVVTVTKGVMNNLNCSLEHQVFCSSTDSLTDNDFNKIKECIVDIAKDI